MRRRVLILFVIAAFAGSAEAQSFEAGVHFASSQWSEFEGNDVGIGGRLTWRPLALVGIDADLTWYPTEFPPDTLGFSSNRVEGLFGATIGPRVKGIRPFAKAAAGFLKVAANNEAFACIAIFPPPLACLMANGPTMKAFEIGGGVAVDTTSRSFVRVDVTDRILIYPGPTFRGPGLAARTDDNFSGGALRVTVGGGIRF
jgi:hypothetical protein